MSARPYPRDPPDWYFQYLNEGLCVACGEDIEKSGHQGWCVIKPLDVEIERLRTENGNKHYTLKVALPVLTITVESVVRRALNQSAAAGDTP